MKTADTLSRVIAATLLLLPGVASAQQPMKNTAIIGLWLMGQSLCDGSESLPIVTTSDPGWGNLAFKRGVRTWAQTDHGASPEKRAQSEFAFAPLMAAANGGLGETMANGLADHLKASLVKANQAQAKTTTPHFLVAYAGQGGRTIEELSIADESTDTRTPAAKQAGGGYYQTSLDDARRAVQGARTQSKDFRIAALVWMQGEGNGGPTGGIVPSRWLDEMPRPQGQQWYRDRLIAYRKQWSQDLCAITKQAGEIPMFTYQTIGPAGEAQLMAADDDAQITMVGPHYMVPSALNSRYSESRRGASIHLTADGERWYGEQVAKVMSRVLVEGEDWQPLRPRQAWTDAARTSVWVEMSVPRPPLVLDEKFFPRQQSEVGTGFSSLAGFLIRDGTGGTAAMTAVEVASPTRVRIRLARPLASGAPCHVSYGQPQAGALGTVAAIRKGPEVSGQPTTELLVSGGLSVGLQSLLAEGAFYATSLTGSVYAQATIRSAQEVQGNTVLRYEDRELRNDTAFAVGQTLTAQRLFQYGNLRDSDAEAAIYSFADKTYGTRAGQPYPLWNWCVLFSHFPISEKE